LEIAARRLGHFPSGFDASREGHSGDGRIFDEGFDIAAWYKGRTEHVRRKSCFAKDVFDCKRTARHVTRMFENSRVSRHQGWGSKAEHLPEWKIPRHDRQHGTK